VPYATCVRAWNRLPHRSPGRIPASRVRAAQRFPKDALPYRASSEGRTRMRRECYRRLPGDGKNDSWTSSQFLDFILRRILVSDQDAAITGKPQLHRQTVRNIAARRNFSGRFKIKLGPSKPLSDLPIAEAQAHMRMFLAKELMVVRCEVDDHQTPTRSQQTRGLFDCSRGVLQIVKHLVHRHQITGVAVN